MSVALDPAGDEALAGPLSSIEIRARRSNGGTLTDTDTAKSAAAVRPLTLRELRPAPMREVLEHVYDPQRQIATDLDGRPLGADLKKDWTTIEGTHTDGDGGDNELWDWEEIK